MSDRVVGIAVLDKTDSPERLYILCETSDGRRLPTSIPMYLRGTPKILPAQWAYTIVGDSLEVTPSLNWVGVFHNAGNWSVKFIEFDPKEYEHPGDKFRAANRLQK